MTQVDIEKIILENGFKLEDKQGHITYEFGTGDIYRISHLLFKKMNYIPCCKSDSEQLNVFYNVGDKVLFNNKKAVVLWTSVNYLDIEIVGTNKILQGVNASKVLPR